MIYVPLTQGYTAIVDDEDAWVLNHKWHAKVCKHTVYAIKGSRENRLRMHRLIMGNPTDQLIDHIDQDGLNNRRSNLRIATRKQNRANSRIHQSNKSGYSGVSVFDRGNYHRWRATININGKKKHLALCKSAEEAARIYDEAAIKEYGEFARLNFPQGNEA